MTETRKGAEVAVTTSPANLLELAIKNSANIEQLKGLMDLQERWDANQAKKAFLRAMTSFQSKCPVIKKDKSVKFNQTHYKYATLGGIAKQISSLLEEFGLSYTWKTEESEKGIKITCTVWHIDGHSETNTMTAELDSSGSKNKIQQVGSTMTYLQRYTLIGALGISTAEDDADGQQPKPASPKKESSAKLIEEAKLIIDEFQKADDLQAKGRPILQGFVKRGLNAKHKKELTDCISNKFESLKS